MGERGSDRQDPSFLSTSVFFQLSAMSDAIQGLPLELLSEILEYVSVPDVLRSKQVEATT